MALIGVAAALVLLAVTVVAFGTATAAAPIQYLQVVGSLLVLFGMRWLRKAMLRYTGVIELRDEAANFIPPRSRVVGRPFDWTGGFVVIAVSSVLSG